MLIYLAANSMPPLDYYRWWRQWSWWTINETSCNAGASLVPSPVTATTWPRLRNACTSRSLSFGEDLPITCTTNFIQLTFHWYIGLLKHVTYVIQTGKPKVHKKWFTLLKTQGRGHGYISGNMGTFVRISLNWATYYYFVS